MSTPLTVVAPHEEESKGGLIQRIIKHASKREKGKGGGRSPDRLALAPREAQGAQKAAEEPRRQDAQR